MSTTLPKLPAASGPDGRGREPEAAWLRPHLARALATAARLPGVELTGQLLRPLVASSLLPAGAEGAQDERFWKAVLAVQLAHEASLLHDDVIDGAAERRGRPTLAADAGVAQALVQGDRLLTAAFRLAVETGSLEFALRFAVAVERTVAGEMEQGRLCGQALAPAQCRRIAAAKSGELLGCALATVPTLAGAVEADRVHELGRRLGLLYQMLDDLLDYCPAAETGKPALGDYAQRRWTWVLAELPDARFGLPADELLRRLHGSTDARGSAMGRCLAALEAEATELTAALREALGERPVLETLIGQWMDRARRAVRREAIGVAPEVRRLRPRGVLERRLAEAGPVTEYLARNSRSFHFAARLFPRADRQRIARVYGYCRFTDDLVDRSDACREVRAEVLDEWLQLSRRAYAGEPTGLAMLDAVMREMAEREVPFSHAEDLIAGVRMDLRPARYATLPALRVYTHRVAGVVGMWIAGLAGIRDAPTLARAAGLGHAMQLTNILRDVGEDWRAGRLYLPADLLARHGVDEATLAAMHEGTAPIGAAYQSLLESLMRVAEQEYRDAFAGIPALPPAYRRPVAVAAGVYRGIHDEIRRRGYDNLRLRAHTSLPTKAALALQALRALRQARLAYPVARTVRAPVPEFDGRASAPATP